MASPQKKITNPIVQRIMADGLFGSAPQQNLSTESKLNMAREGTFNNLRAPSSGFGGPNVTTVTPEISPGAINTALNPFMAGVAGTPTPSASTGSTVPGGMVPGGVMGAGIPAATGTALGVDTMRQMYDEARQRRLFIDPYIPTAKMGAEAAASRFGYLDKLAMRAGGQNPFEAANPVFRGVDASGRPTLTNRTPDGGTSLGKPTGTAPATTAYDQNRAVVSGMANEGRQSIQDAAVMQQMRAGVLKGLEPGTMLDPADPSRVIPIPGSMAELKYKQAQQEMVKEGVAAEKEAASDAERNRLDLASAESMLSTIDRVLPRISSKTVGWGSLMDFIPESDAKNVKVDIEKIEAALGVNKLQQIRSLAANGASGFGQFTDREFTRLVNSQANLDRAQSPEQLRQTLMEIRESYDNLVLLARGINPLTRKAIQPGEKDPYATTALPPEKQKRLEELRAKLGK